MQITDAQLHIWSKGKPSSHHRQEPFTPDMLLSEMKTAGVAQAFIVPPSWDPDGNVPANKAAMEHPDKFAVMGGLNLDKPEFRKTVAELKASPRMRGFRIMFTTPERRVWLSDGRADWLWNEAEKHNIPLSVHVPNDLRTLAGIAGKHPGLRLIVDHLGVPPNHPGTDASFDHIPDLIALAALPNVAVKATGVAGYSRLAYPYVNLHDHLHRVFDAFGPMRFFWGSDLTRMGCTYRQCVTLFTEELPWLSESDKTAVMGAAVRDWIGWE